MGRVCRTEDATADKSRAADYHLARQKERNSGGDVKDYTNSHITFLIDEHIHNKRDREIMKLHYVDGISADTISKRKDIDLTPRRVSQILSDRLLEIAPYL